MTGQRRLAFVLLALSLLPAAILVAQRWSAEERVRTVAMVMDHEALQEQAHLLGVDPFELALAYQAAGLSGIAIYEDTPESLALAGRAAVTSGHQAIATAVAAGAPVPDLPGHATLVHALEPGATDRLVFKAATPPETVQLGGRSWVVLPGDVLDTQPAGPDLELIDRYADAGFDVAYRPRNAPGLREVGSDFPDRARYLVHAGLDLAGHPNALSELAAGSQGYLTALIEGTPQDGFASVRTQIPTVRLLSFNQDHLNRHLRPAELVDKFLLAAEERNVRLLYLRPYTEEQLGDMRANTEALLTGLNRALDAAGFQVGPLPTDASAMAGYAPAGWLRAAAGVGIVAGLLLLASLFPGGWGVAAAAAVAGVSVAVAGASFAALALIAALVFPVLGYGLWREGRWALPAATGISLLGAVLLVAVGSDAASVLGLSPFRGVALTLVVPPALYLAHALLRVRGPGSWLRTLWSQPIRLGHVAVALIGVTALALVVVRRGNTPLIPATDLELQVREFLSTTFARPRFKELLGHPAAVLGLAGRSWPEWIRAPLLTGGVVAQASILNSFSHYHTPLAVSLERTVVALAIGVGLGLILVPIAAGTVRVATRWLRNA
ncbi:MAG: DUF5693 family protein [Trueperaceae bacterium]